MGYANNLVYFPPNQRMYYIQRGSPTRVWEVVLDRANWSASTVTELTTTGDVFDSDESGFAYDSWNHVIGGGVSSGVFRAFDPVTRRWSSAVMQVQGAGGPVGTQAFHTLDFDPVDGVFLFLTGYNDGSRMWAYRYGSATPSALVHRRRHRDGGRRWHDPRGLHRAALTSEPAAGDRRVRHREPDRDGGHRLPGRVGHDQLRARRADAHGERRRPGGHGRRDGRDLRREPERRRGSDAGRRAGGGHHQRRRCAGARPPGAHPRQRAVGRRIRGHGSSRRGRLPHRAGPAVVVRGRARRGLGRPVTRARAPRGGQRDRPPVRHAVGNRRQPGAALGEHLGRARRRTSTSASAATAVAPPAAPTTRIVCEPGRPPARSRASTTAPAR